MVFEKNRVFYIHLVLFHVERYSLCTSLNWSISFSLNSFLVSKPQVLLNSFGFSQVPNNISHQTISPFHWCAFRLRYDCDVLLLFEIYTRPITAFLHSCGKRILPALYTKCRWPQLPYLNLRMYKQVSFLQQNLLSFLKDVYRRINYFQSLWTIMYLVKMDLQVICLLAPTMPPIKHKGDNKVSNHSSPNRPSCFDK